MVMGLDMYLYRREYISDWDWQTEADHQKEGEAYKYLMEYMGAERCADSPHANVEFCVAYWRKANAIHKWFCDLDGGKDECQSIYVSRDDLVRLRGLAWQVATTPAIASRVLPTKEGFFFGSYDYDEWYMDSMKHTVKQIDSVLASVPEDSRSDFIYRASW